MEFCDKLKDLQAVFTAEAGGVIIVIGIITGLVMILYAQLKYSKGIS